MEQPLVRDGTWVRVKERKIGPRQLDGVVYLMEGIQMDGEKWSDHMLIVRVPCNGRCVDSHPDTWVGYLSDEDGIPAREHATHPPMIMAQERSYKTADEVMAGEATGLTKKLLN